MYEPPFDPTDKITATALDIAEMVGRLAPDSALSSSPVLHRELRIKTIHSSLAIEQNTLTMEQVTDIIDGRRVFGPPDDIREVRNAKRAYDLLGNWDPRNMDDLLEAHGVMMEGLRKDAGTFRTKNAGVYDGDRLIHAGTPASYVPEVMADLFEWLGSTKLHPLLASCVFHYEFEFIHPFSDGNGRIGRLWHTLLLARWRSVLAWLPIESMIRERQDAYYAALNESNATGSSTAFVAFMLSAIRDAMEPFCTEERREDGLRNSILSLMAENPSITVSEIAEAVGLARRTTERAIASLKESGRVRRVGSPRAGHNCWSRSSARCFRVSPTAKAAGRRIFCCCASMAALPSARSTGRCICCCSIPHRAFSMCRSSAGWPASSSCAFCRPLWREQMSEASAAAGRGSRLRSACRY